MLNKPNYDITAKITLNQAENIIFENLGSKVRNSNGSTKKKSKFETVNQSIKTVIEKTKIFIDIDSDQTIKKNMDFFLSYIDSIAKEADSLKLALEDLKKYYKNEGGV